MINGTQYTRQQQAAPSFTVGHNISEFLQSLVNHHIQDPVSLAKFDNGTGDMYVTLNMADDNGRCALGLYKYLLPPTILAHASNNWILQAAKLYETYNSTKALTHVCRALWLKVDAVILLMPDCW